MQESGKLSTPPVLQTELERLRNQIALAPKLGYSPDLLGDHQESYIEIQYFYFSASSKDSARETNVELEAVALLWTTDELEI